MKKIIIAITLLYGFTMYSQKENRHSNFKTDFFYGFLIEHDKSLNKAIQKNPYGVLLSYNYVNSKSSKFNELFNYPERGFSFLYQNFNSSVLGQGFAGYRHYTYNLSPKKKYNLKLTTAFGIGYVTKKYDAKKNPYNFAFGSNLQVSAYLKLQFYQLLLSKQLLLNAGVSLIHFSNTSYKNPNLGINTVALNLGVNYNLKKISIHKNKELLEKENINKSLKYNLVIRAGLNESKIPNSGLFPFYTTTFYAQKSINPYSTVTFGVDFFNAHFLKKYIKHINQTKKQNHNPNKYQRAGIFVGHELTQNRFAFISQIGYHVYAPFVYEFRIYERFGFKYKLSKHLFSEITLKANLFRAEGLEFGLGYQF